MKRFFSRLVLAQLAYAMVRSGATNRLAEATPSVSPYPDCDGAVVYVADGDCDPVNNNEGCGYDGGDCCICTCSDTADYMCGENGGYACDDPSVPEECVEASNEFVPTTSADTPTSSSASQGTPGEFSHCFSSGGFVPWINDGWCHPPNAIDECGYDGGDCCICTCGGENESNCGLGGYVCQDPSVSQECVEESEAYNPPYYTGTSNNYSSSETPLFAEYPDCANSSGFPPYIADGWCDSINSNAECGYDGGDCCICTCEEDLQYACGITGFDCRDPSVSEACVEESDAFEPLYNTEATESYSASSHLDDFPNCTDAGGHLPYIADGWCDPMNVNEECGYDGGDCCTCTCAEDAEFVCGLIAYDCQDPSVSEACAQESNDYVPPPLGGTTSANYSSSSPEDYPACIGAGGVPTYIGDGDCDSVNSIEKCAYDGGDCCICTCESTDAYTCGENVGYDCHDPSVSEECAMQSQAYVAP